MIYNQILRSSSTLTGILYHRVLPRFGSTLSKESSSSPNKSTNKTNSVKSGSEYLAADMYNYTPFSYYDMEISMTKYRLPQPSPDTPFKSPEPAPQKK